MKGRFRYVVYLIIGFLVYQIIDSGETGLTHQDAKNWLIGAIIIVFILLLIVRIIKQRYE